MGLCGYPLSLPEQEADERTVKACRRFGSAEMACPAQAQIAAVRELVRNAAGP